MDNAGCDQHMFHMNPRPNEGTVVRNANFGDWGDEERDIDYFPFSPGQYFDSTIMATDGGYEVSGQIGIGPDKRTQNGDYFLIHQFKYMFWVLKITVSLRRFF